MPILTRFVVIFWATLLAGTPAAAQLPVASEPHLALDELAKEYKRFGLPLPPRNAELVRLKLDKFRDYPDELGFRIPPIKPGEEPNYLVGSRSSSLVTSAELVKPGSDILNGVAPEYVSDMLCLAVQCRVRGLNEFAHLLYARAREAIATPVPARWGPNLLGRQIRVNGWELREAENSSVLKELRLTAEAYWHPRVMESDSDRQEVLRYLKVLHPDGHADIRDLEQTLAPRKSKPGTVESLIDDLIDWTPEGWTRKQERGRVAYWKLVELGFDAVPALLEHVEDERLTRYEYTIWNVKLGPVGTSRVRVRHVVGQLLNDLSGRELVQESGPQSVDVEKARAWWEKARKEGEEKWLVAHAVPEDGWQSDASRANSVIFRALGAKYPARLGEFYRTVLVKHPQRGSSVLANEIAASKLPRAEKLALLVEAAEHKRLTHRLAALTVVARLDPPLFRKHLLATLQKLPPGIEKTRNPYARWFSNQQSELAKLVGQTDDPACWDALAEVAKQSAIDVRIEIIQQFTRFKLNRDKPTRREPLRFVLQFLSDDESDTPLFGPDNEESPGPRVGDVAAEILADQLGLQAQYGLWRMGGLERLLFRAAVAKLAAEELERLKK